MWQAIKYYFAIQEAMFLINQNSEKQELQFLKKKKKKESGMASHSNTQEASAGRSFEFEATLVYRVPGQPGWHRGRSCGGGGFKYENVLEQLLKTPTDKHVHSTELKS